MSDNVLSQLIVGVTTVLVSLVGLIGIVLGRKHAPPVVAEDDGKEIDVGALDPMLVRLVVRLVNEQVRQAREEFATELAKAVGERDQARTEAVTEKRRADDLQQKVKDLEERVAALETELANHRPQSMRTRITDGGA